MSNFHIGQRVVCVDDSAGRFAQGDEWHLVKGKIYTISAVAIVRGKVPVCQIAEHAMERGSYLLSKRFRPVDEKRIDVFRALLTPIPTKADA